MLKRVKTMMVIITLSIMTGQAFAEETVGCPHAVGKGKFKVRGKIGYIQAQKCYSDEVWKAFHNDSPYQKDYDRMVDLPDGWHLKKHMAALGLEYGITSRLNAGVFMSFMMKDMKRQIWSKNANKTVWKEVEDNGVEALWLSAKYLVYSKSPGLFGFDWEDGLFFSVGYKPPISSDEEIENGIGSGTNDLKIVVLSHPHFTKNFFLCSDVWYQYCGKVKKIEEFSKSEWDLGDKFAYRAFLGHEFGFLNQIQRFAIVGGLQGWISVNDKDSTGNEIEDSDKYSHAMIAKFRWMPFGEEDAGSIDLGVKVPYASKTAFASTFIPTLCGRITF